MNELVNCEIQYKQEYLILWLLLIILGKLELIIVSIVFKSSQ